MMIQRDILVLIVDDEPLVRFTAREGVEDAGFETIDAGNADEALRILEARADVGILFTDVHMPGSLNGLELSHQVSMRWPAIQLVLTSGRSTGQGAPERSRFLPKPFTIESLQEILQTISGSAPLMH